MAGAKGCQTSPPDHRSLGISGGVLRFPHAIPFPPIDTRLVKRYQSLVRDLPPAARSTFDPHACRGPLVRWITGGWAEHRTYPPDQRGRIRRPE